MELKDIWAKTAPRQSIITHGITAGIVSQCLFDHYLSESDKKLLSEGLELPIPKARDFLAYLVSIHDLGKIEFNFQSADPDTYEKLMAAGVNYAPFGLHHYRHELTGRVASAGIWQDNDEDDDAIDVYSAIIGAHHQKNSGEGSRDKQPVFKTYRKEFESLMRERFWKGEELPLLTGKEEGAVEAILLGALILSDWIASGETFADAENWLHTENGQQTAYEKCLQFLTVSGLLPGEAEWADNFTDIWPWIPRSGVRPVQAVIETLFGTDGRYALVLIEAPMGEGKTEAGMYAASQMITGWGKDGFYAALPTAATSNQMVERMRSWLEALKMPESVRLLHGMAWMVDPYTPTASMNTEDNAEALRWLAPVRRGLLAQFSVGTIDQVMLAVSKTKFGVLRLLGLSNKVLVIDEIHSYDVYMGEFIIRLLEWCRALCVPVVMLSATLPPQLKTKLLSPYTTRTLSKAYPLITAVKADGTLVEQPVPNVARKQNVSVRLLPILNDPAAIAKAASDAGSGGGCICVLMNTIGQAQSVYSEIEKVYDGECLLFHAQFPADKRNEIEKECLRKFGKDKSHRPEKAILVATQVVEQSLDVDFDFMLTAVAPIDLVLQRMGRVHRHDETLRPTCFRSASIGVLVPENDNFGTSGYVYPEVLLKQSVRVLEKTTCVHIPDDLAALVEEGYDETGAPAEDAEKWIEKNIEDQIKAGQSLQYLINPPDKMLTAIHRDIFFEDDEQSDFLSVKTRLGPPSVRIALLEPDLFEEIQPFVVEKDGKKYAQVTNRTLAKRIFGKSVSVSRRKLKNKSDLLVILGDKLISEVMLYPAQDGKYLDPVGGTIRYDEKLGVIIEEG